MTCPGWGLAFAFALCVACGSSEASVAPGAEPAAAGDAPTTGASGDTLEPPAGCDPNADPKDSPACLDNSYALFVDASSGGDNYPGTRELPMKTLGKAIDVRGRKRRIYACGGTYDEHIFAQGTFSVYGGFACGTWSYDGSKAKIAPRDQGIALYVDQSNGGLLEDLEIVAPPGASAGDSSIGLFVAESPSITLRRVKIAANEGANGADGDDAMVPMAVGSLDGIAGRDTFGGPGKDCVCASTGVSEGGRGGDPTGPWPNGGNGLSLVQTTMAPAVGQTQVACEGGGLAAAIGADGRSGLDEAPASLGDLVIGAWNPGQGFGGESGGVGQGGGGGGSYGRGTSEENGGGGSGGCGGCGGGAGGGGAGGNASIALASVQSTVLVRSCELSAANGGVGGRGKPGASGSAGGVGALGANRACKGGDGGIGGAGGAGAGGAGGLSVAVLWSAGEPLIDGATTVLIGKAGVGGVGGAASNAGPDGQAAAVMQIR